MNNAEMGQYTCIIYILYLLLDSYKYLYFFSACTNIFMKKYLLPTTNILNPFPVNGLECSRLFVQVTTMLLQLECKILDLLHINYYLSGRYMACSV